MRETLPLIRCAGRARIPAPNSRGVPWRNSKRCAGKSIAWRAIHSQWRVCSCRCAKYCPKVRCRYRGSNRQRTGFTSL